ncbi:MAG: VCBS repeat-containing protein [Planctomycetaceae bacterium]|nr:VCBS repeat-containing protein [Planctomycetaceae bacterium]
MLSLSNIYRGLTSRFYSADKHKTIFRNRKHRQGLRIQPSTFLEILESRQMLSGVSTDLVIALTSNQVAAEQGSEITYDITVANNGPEAVTDAQVVDDVAAFLDNATWTATLNGGATGNTSGTGDLNETVMLPVGGSIHYVLSGTVQSDAQKLISNVATISSPSNTDPAPENNQAGDADVVVVLATSGRGLFEMSDQVDPETSVRYWAVDLGDIDGDGDLDAVTAGGYGDDIEGESNLRIWINDGSGVFTEDLQLTPPETMFDAKLADFNGDGTLDIYANGSESEAVHYLWTNDGTGTFTQHARTVYDFYTTFTEVGDVNNDGYVDVVAEDEFVSVRVLLNDGLGNFTEYDVVSNSTGFVTDIELGDFDADGDLDMVVTNRPLYSNPGETRIFTNDGTGDFSISQEFYDNEPNTADVGDVDGDGDLDIVIGTRSDSQNFAVLLLNDGAGNFDYGDIIQPQYKINDITLVDLDADGDQDIVFSKLGNSTISPAVSRGNEIFINDGTGAFILSTDMVGLTGGAHAVGDLNGDGSLDVFMLQGGSSKEVWFNTNKLLLPYSNDFEDPDGGLDGVLLTSPATSEVLEVSGNHKLQFDNSGYTGLTTALLDLYDPLVESFTFSATVRAVGGVNQLQNGFLIFDYHNENDFKYAGMLPGQNQWIVGHYQGNWANRVAQVDWDDSGRDIKANQDYHLQIQVLGDEVRLFVDDEFITKGSFSGNLNSGMVGLASYHAVTCFDNLELAEGGSYFLDYYEDFNTSFPVQFEFNSPANVQVEQSDGAGELHIDTTGSQGLGLAVHPLDQPLSSNWKVEADLKAVSGPNRWHDGFIIFDYQNENDFKYAGMFNGQNQWVIGHYLGDWGNRLLTIDGDDSGFQIDADTFYYFEVEAIGDLVRFSVDGELIGAVEFPSGLSGGAIGLAAYNAETMIDEFRFYMEGEAGLRKIVPYMQDFEGEDYAHFTFYHADSNDFNFEEGFDGKALIYNNTSGSISDRYGFAVLENSQQLPHNFDFSAEIVSGGGLIFDWKDETNYKYVDVAGRLWEVRNEEFPGTLLKNGDIPGFGIQDGKVINLHLSVRGGVIEVFVDQVKFLEYEFDDPQLNDGALGVFARYDHGEFDNIKISEEAVPQGDFDPSFRFDMESSFGPPSNSFETTPNGDWEYVHDEGAYFNASNRLQVDSSTGTPLATALIRPLNNLPETFEMMVEITAVAQPNSWQDGFIIFDYHSPTDFKYAGMLAGQNQWVVGHYQNGFTDRELSVDWDDIGRSINPGEVYLVHIKIDGGEVELRVDTEIIGTAAFGAPVNAGQIGLGNYNGKTLFDDFRVGKNVAQLDDIDFDYTNNLNKYYNSSDRPFFEVNDESVLYYQLNNVLNINATSQHTVGAFILPSEGLPVDYHVGVEFLSRSDPQPFRTGFIIFDYKHENDFKFAGALVTQDRWVIGHYQGHFGNRLADINWADEGREIYTNKYYELDLNVSGSDVELLVDGESIASVTFDEPVNGGEVGFGVKGSWDYFRNFVFDVTTPSPAAIDAAFGSTEEENLTI